MTITWNNILSSNFAAFSIKNVGKTVFEIGIHWKWANCLWFHEKPSKNESGHGFQANWRLVDVQFTNQKRKRSTYNGNLMFTTSTFGHDHKSMDPTLQLDLGHIRGLHFGDLGLKFQFILRDLDNRLNQTTWSFHFRDLCMTQSLTRRNGIDTSSVVEILGEAIDVIFIGEGTL